MRQFNIRQYVALVTLIPLIIITGLMEAFFLHNYFSEIDLHIENRGKLISSQLESSSEYGVVSNNLPFLQGIAQSVLQQQDVHGVMLLNSASQLLVKSGNFSGSIRDALANAQQIGKNSLPEIIRNGNQDLLIYQPIVPETVKLDEYETAPDNKPVGMIIIQMSLERSEKLKSKTLWYTIAATTALLALIGFIIHLASRRITGPISSLNNALHEIANGNLGARTFWQYHISELNMLAANINMMAQQLQESQSLLERRIEEATRDLREKIAEAERTHQELRESEDRYRTLYTNTPVMLHSIGRDGVIISVSDYWLSQMGYRRDEVIGKKSVDFLTGNSCRYATEKILPVFMETGAISDVYYQFVKKDGSVMDTLLSATAEKDNEGKVIRSLAVVIDITERKKNEELLRQSEEKLRAYLDNISDTIWLIEPSLEISYVSSGITRLLGFLPEEMAGKPSAIVIHPDDIGIVGNAQRLAMEYPGEPHTIQYRVRHKDGRWILVESKGVNLLDNPAINGVLVVMRDISERMRAQDELLAAKNHAEQANRAKTKFLAAVSHDLRQPIHAQGLFLEALARTELSAYQAKLLTNARATSDASSEMLSTLLDFSRIDAGIVKPRLQSFSLQPLLNKVENELAPQADEKGIVYRTRETHLVVQSDPALVELILRNLVSNAIRYTRHGGLLVGCRLRGKQASLEVWDTGIGIAPEHREDVFREFYQLDNPERDSVKGLGLGLAIAQGLARTLGHELTLASTPQKGSVFRLSLPIATEPLPVKQAEWAQTRTQLLTTRVLVIDDDETVRGGMGHLLSDWGFECDLAESAEEAIALARAHAPDLVICDYRMRRQSTGLEAIAALRELLGDALPALLITGDTAPDLLHKAQASGIPLLHKPVSPGHLYRNLMEMLETSKKHVVLK